MKRWTIVCLGLFLAALAISGASAFDPKQYPVRTIPDVTRQVGDFFAKTAAGTDTSPVYLIDSGPAFSTTVKFQGQMRAISEQRLSHIETFGKLSGISLKGIFVDELLFREKDGSEWWLPMQKTHVDAFEKEYRENADIVLYLIPVAVTHENGSKSILILINEFTVK